ncbi:MAG: bifunctional 2-C-methyl-D-erythritol 4-phosphate cytidylyltransferase/2-C-methyl-D-erythritol 2,4-cyclodiphosphate synthase [Alphaproteobacteria bacterium]|nr:bifunctional 2-C-methyl-D-erythritol 4-phosphate cytidylyltransferase/2-C-methyl-D-erythritol 2,4-cyclodiphosphate synthase [Alphaproteobacteria bacterium]
MGSFAALIVAGGSGSRFGGSVPKQYETLGRLPIIRRAVNAFLAAKDCCALQVVIGAGQEVHYASAMRGLDALPPVPGGETRQESVRRGLDALSPHAPEFVLIHDAARPLVSSDIIASVAAVLKQGAEAVVPLLPVSDSLRQMNGGLVGDAIPRDWVCRVQTPQGFLYAGIREAHARFAGGGATDDIALAERAGMKIIAVAGEEANIKVTTESDLAFAERLVGGKADIRTGGGFDVHRFTAGDHVWLCGIRIPHACGLEGHSDADAGLHALTDAILGAVAAGDIGQHFPPSDPKWKHAASRLFLAHAAELVKQRGGTILHCDITIICEAPKIGPHRGAMRASVAEILELDIGRVSVKATTTEGLGFTGRSEGLAAQATATIRLPT